MPNAKSIENAKKRDARKLTFICDNCGKEYEITYGRYRHLKDKSKHRCKKCGKKLWFNDFSEERQQEFRDKHSQTYANKSDEEKELIRQHKKDAWNNKSKEEKLKHGQISSKNMHNYWETLDDELFAYRIEQGTDNLKNYKENQTPEEAARVSQKMSISGKLRWENTPQEEKDRINDKKSKSKKQWWDGLSIEEYEETCYNVAIDNNQSYHHNMDTDTEREFANVLNQYHIKFRPQIYNIIKHPDFNDKFPSNSVVESKYVNPYHSWDFIVHTNDKDIFVDIDGSVHDPSKANSYVTVWTGVRCKLRDLVDFYDSQRIYQTDGLNAYIIKCYDDILTNDTLVENIKTKEIIKFKEFINLIQAMNMNENELKVAINVMNKKRSNG